MDLRTYLFIEKMTITDFAHELGASRNHISGVVHGRRKPGRTLAKSIERLTKGIVTESELITNTLEREDT